MSRACPLNRPEISAFIIAGVNKKTNREMQEEINQTWNLNVSEDQVKGWRQRNGYNGIRGAVSRPHKSFLFNDVQQDLVAWFGPTMTNTECAELISKYGRKVTAAQIKHWRNRNHVLTGKDGRFQKGHIPVNPIKPGEHRCPEREFYVGMNPINHKEIGSVRQQHDGYFLVKIAEPSVWRLRARVVWEKANGPIPAGHKLYHVDGDRTNDSLDNLRLVTDAEIGKLCIKELRLNPGETEMNHAKISIAQILSKTEAVND